MCGFMTPHKAKNHNYCLQYNTFMNLDTDSLDAWTTCVCIHPHALPSRSLAHSSHIIHDCTTCSLAQSITQHFESPPPPRSTCDSLVTLNCTTRKPHRRTTGHVRRRAHARQHPSDSPWQLWHLHKAEHIHGCCRLQSKLHMYHLLHSGSIVSGGEE